ncbi:UNVERIFIED_ORG: hypothetical protein QE434_002200 [Rhizobium sp. SORGH_AS 755]|nr:hypothetical protein [Rhizobium sp. SORGH_AS_0755]
MSTAQHSTLTDSRMEKPRRNRFISGESFVWSISLSQKPLPRRVGAGRLTHILEEWTPLLTPVALYYSGRNSPPAAFTAFIQTPANLQKRTRAGIWLVRLRIVTHGAPNRGRPLGAPFHQKSIPAPAGAGAASFFGFSAIIASVVTRRPATEAAS